MLEANETFLTIVYILLLYPGKMYLERWCYASSLYFGAIHFLIIAQTISSLEFRPYSSDKGPDTKLRLDDWKRGQQSNMTIWDDLLSSRKVKKKPRASKRSSQGSKFSCGIHTDDGPACK